MTIGSNVSRGQYLRDGWSQWPDQPELSFQFLRALGASQEGASTIGECMLAATRMTPGDLESWYREWQRLGDVNLGRAEQAASVGHVRTAAMNWLRAANYYRSSEFYLAASDSRRIQAFDQIEGCSHRYLKTLAPAGEVVEIPYQDGQTLTGYFLRAPTAEQKQPVVIAFGGLDEYKDELLHEMPKHALPRGMALLLVDLPGQGSSLRRKKMINRHDTEVPVSRIVDFLIERDDVDANRIALYGASIGGYYAPRAAAFEHRIAAVVSDGAMWDLGLRNEGLRDNPDALIVMHLKWVFGEDDIEALIAKGKTFKLEGVIDTIRCPYLIVHGEHDHLGLDRATDSFAYARKAGLDVTLKLFSEDETGASHCQVDNPTLGQEFICDWLADKLGIDQQALVTRSQQQWF